jgi:hypothetical protein
MGILKLTWETISVHVQVHRGLDCVIEDMHTHTVFVPSLGSHADGQRLLRGDRRSEEPGGNHIPYLSSNRKLPPLGHTPFGTIIYPTGLEGYISISPGRSVQALGS